MDKTMGQLLDEYIATKLDSGERVSSLYMYMEDYKTPKLVINTAEDSYDYTEILFKVVDLQEQEQVLKSNVKALQDKVRQLEKSKKDVEKAIKLLRNNL